MDKYIIDGIEYSYGEEVEVSCENRHWETRYFVGYIKGADCPIMCVSAISEEDYLDKSKFLTYPWAFIRKIQPTLSGRKAKLILDDGTEYSVTVG